MRALGFLFVVVAVLGCGPTQKCAPGSCSGCCDSTGQCQTGNTNVNCGNGGLLCNACFTGQQCNLGICASSGSGGGSSSGGGGGATGGGGGTATGGGGGTATGGGGGATGGGSGSAWTTWCPGYVTSVCDASVRCGAYASATVCRAFANAVGICNPTPAINDGRQALDSTAAAACLNSMSGACEAADLTACGKALRGTVQPNQGCYNTVECATNLYCNLSSTCPGLCQPAIAVGQALPPGASCVSGYYGYGGVCVANSPIGQSCAPQSPQTTDRTCVPEAFCQAVTKVCTAKRLAGQSCSTSNAECAGLLQCHGGVCEALGTSSAACDTTRSCRADLKCSATNVCVPLADVNAACTSAFGDCRYDLICDKPVGSSAGTCQAIHTIGQSCTSGGYQCGLFNSGNYCTATSVTPTGVCALKKGVGASCVSYEECKTSSCAASVCAGCADPTP